MVKRRLNNVISTSFDHDVRTGKGKLNPLEIFICFSLNKRCRKFDRLIPHGSYITVAISSFHLNISEDI